MNIVRVKTTDSTNRLLKELTARCRHCELRGTKQEANQTIVSQWIASGSALATTGNAPLEEGTVVVAETQTAGRGQKGSFWEAAAGQNITCSLLLYPTFLSLKQHFLLSKIVVLGVKETLDFLFPHLLPFFIKWPNDIYHKDRKIAGILIENELMDDQITQSVVGIGLNVNQEVFTSDALNPVSLKQLTSETIDLDYLLGEMIRRIMYWYQKLKDNQSEKISTVYHDALYRKNGFFCYEDKNGVFDARIGSVSDDGFLHLITQGGEERRYAFKEVSFCNSFRKNAEV